jgi:L-lactate utilization protein LutB
MYIKEAGKRKIEYVIKNLEKRNMNGYYCENAEEANQKILSLIKDGELVSWGGSATLDAIGIKALLPNVFDATKAPPEKAYDEKKKTLMSDVYLTSTNAITMDGELVNIDGTGNRVAAMCFGPNKVIVVAGVNKIAENEEAALARIRTEACPPNCVRLGRTTPCAITGKCGQCLTPGQTICSYTVTTRFSSINDRIHVILVNESLGF